MATKIELCNVEVGAVLKVEKDDLTLAVFNLEGEFFVIDDHCTLCGSSPPKKAVRGATAREGTSRRSKSKLSAAAAPRQRHG